VDSQIRSLQALRGVACLAVVALHLAGFEQTTWVSRPLAGWGRTFGWSGVDLFFVLSGFIITWTQDKQLGRPAALGGYLARRLWRIFPLFWACWAFAVVVHVLVCGVTLTAPGWIGDWARQLLLWPWGHGTPYVPVAWSLSYEVVFYLVFGLFVLLPRRSFVPLLAAWTAVVAGKLVILPPPGDGPTWLPVAPLTLEFITGCWTAVACRRLSGRMVPCLVLGVAGFAAGVACLDLWYAEISVWRAALLGPPGGLLVYGLIGLERSGRLRPPAWLCRIGDASYSIYLTHWTIAIFALAATQGWPHSRLGHPLWLATMLAAMVGGGYLCYLGIERPLIQVAKRRRTVGSRLDQGVDRPAARAA
jgi:peptidoglycan/LPS O-acetylase OafA/YrhL